MAVSEEQNFVRTWRVASAAQSGWKLEFSAQHSIKRIWSAAPQRNRERNETPHQCVFVATFEPREADIPIYEKDYKHLDCRCCGEKTRE